jgi:hypothetical protein
LAVNVAHASSPFAGIARTNPAVSSDPARTPPTGAPDFWLGFVQGLIAAFDLIASQFSEVPI